MTQKRQQLIWQQRRLQHPGQRVQQWALRLDELDMRLLNAVKRRQRDGQQRLDVLHARLQRHRPTHYVQQLRARLEYCQRQLPLLMQRQLQQQRQQWSGIAQLLHSVSPLATLQRGYAIVSDKRGALLRDARDVAVGDTISAQLAQGSLVCTVDAIQPASIQFEPIKPVPL
jgi:exodeoxyribonuclease VII large subunit